MGLEQSGEFHPHSYRVVNSDHNIELAIGKVLAGKTIGGKNLGVTISDNPVTAHGFEFVELHFSDPKGKEVFERLHRSPKVLALIEQLYSIKGERPDVMLIKGTIERALDKLFD